MERLTTTSLRIGDWIINPASGVLSRGGETARLEPRALSLLLCLANRAGEVVSIDELLNEVWPGVNVGSDSVYQAVTSLRRVLGDDPKQPVYIATVPRLGYRMMAAVGPDTDATVVETSAAADVKEPNPAKTVSRRGAELLWFAGLLLCVAILAGLVLHFRAVKHASSVGAVTALESEKSIAVLPFLDLTETMNKGPFADGMTEELIDRLSKIPGLRVSSATSSFYYKDKQIPVADIAKALGVAYVLDGSVRKSGVRVRVAARLIRVDSGFVVWSETYDRPLNDILMVQDDIAGAATKALRASIEGRP